MSSNLSWCNDSFEYTYWNGKVVRAAFFIDSRDREIVSWKVVVNAGISGSDIRDLTLEAVEKRFGLLRASEGIEMLADNGLPYAVKDTKNLPASSI